MIETSITFLPIVGFVGYLVGYAAGKEKGRQLGLEAMAKHFDEMNDKWSAKKCRKEKGE